jgi:hypothetical protein
LAKSRVIGARHQNEAVGRRADVGALEGEPAACVNASSVDDRWYSSVDDRSLIARRHALAQSNGWRATCFVFAAGWTPKQPRQEDEMTTSWFAKFPKRKLLSAVAGFGFIAGTAACGAVGDPAEGSSSGSSSAPIQGGTVAGGVGVVRVTIWSGVGGTPAAFCTGTVFAGNRIITAAHCFDTWLTIRDGGDVTYLLEGDGLLARVDYTEDGTNWTCLTHPTDTVCGDGIAAFASMHVSRMSGAGNLPDIAVIRFASPLQRIEASRFRLLATGPLRLGQNVDEWGSGFTDSAGSTGGLTSAVMKRALVRVTELTATAFETSNAESQTCDGDSGGPAFTGASDLIVGIHRSATGSGVCASVSSTGVFHRITPTVIGFIDGRRQGSDPACRETIPGAGFYDCS